MRTIEITDPDDHRVRAFTSLTDEQLRRFRESSDGDLAGLFIAEGGLVAERARMAGYRIESVLVDRSLTERVPSDLDHQVPVFTAATPILEAISGFRYHRGFLACFHRPEPESIEGIVSDSRRLVVCENVTDATNLGAIARNTAALGFDALLVDPTSCDPYYRRVTRVSMGTVFALPHARIGKLPGGLDALAGFRTVALSPTGVPIREVTVGADERIAVILGSEMHGISPATLQAADEVVSIPMHGGVDSLNVASAAAVTLFHFGRTRQS